MGLSAAAAGAGYYMQQQGGGSTAVGNYPNAHGASSLPPPDRQSGGDIGSRRQSPTTFDVSAPPTTQTKADFDLGSEWLDKSETLQPRPIKKRSLPELLPEPTQSNGWLDSARNTASRVAGWVTGSGEGTGATGGESTSGTGTTGSTTASSGANSAGSTTTSVAESATAGTSGSTTSGAEASTTSNPFERKPSFLRQTEAAGYTPSTAVSDKTHSLDGFLGRHHDGVPAPSHVRHARSLDNHNLKNDITKSRFRRWSLLTGMWQARTYRNDGNKPIRVDFPDWVRNGQITSKVMRPGDRVEVWNKAGEDDSVYNTKFVLDAESINAPQTTVRIGVKKRPKVFKDTPTKEDLVRYHLDTLVSEWRAGGSHGGPDTERLVRLDALTFSGFISPDEHKSLQQKTASYELKAKVDNFLNSPGPFITSDKLRPDSRRNKYSFRVDRSYVDNVLSRWGYRTNGGQAINDLRNNFELRIRAGIAGGVFTRSLIDMALDGDEYYMAFNQLRDGMRLQNGQEYSIQFSPINVPEYQPEYW